MLSGKTPGTRSRIAAPWNQCCKSIQQFSGKMSLIFSNQVLHWVHDRETAAKNISQLLTTLTLTVTKTLLRLTIESLFGQIARQLAFFNCSISFYLYTLAGSQFRLELRQIINRLTMFICHKRLLEKRRIGINNNLAAPNVRQLAGRTPQANLNKNEQTTINKADQM